MNSSVLSLDLSVCPFYSYGLLLENKKNLEKRKLVFTTFPMQGKSNAQIIYSSEGQRSTQG